MFAKKGVLDKCIQNMSSEDKENLKVVLATLIEIFRLMSIKMDGIVSNIKLTFI
jgi:hypothetical protein